MAPHELSAERLMDLCVEFRRRSTEDPALTPDTFCSEYPLEADQLRPLLATTRLASVAGPAEPQDYPRFRRLSTLGAGGFGEVWRVNDADFPDRVLALKRLRPDRPELANYMVEEIETLRLVLGHPGVPKIYDSFRGPAGEPYFTMEYIEGASLDNVLLSGAPLDLQRALRLLGQILAVLQHIHERGVIHRDLKPSNIMLVRPGMDDEHVTLIDFGVSTRMNLARGQTTQFADDGYKPPEQLSSREDERVVDQSTDLYALGVIAAHMLVRVPAHGSPRQAVQSSPTLDADLKDFVLALMADRVRRPQSTAQAARWLQIVHARRLPWPARIRQGLERPALRTLLLAVVLAAVLIGAWKLVPRFFHDNRTRGNPATLAAGDRDPSAVNTGTRAVPVGLPSRARPVPKRSTPGGSGVSSTPGGNSNTNTVWQKEYLIAVFPPDARLFRDGTAVEIDAYGRGHATLKEGDNAFEALSGDLRVPLSYQAPRNDPNTKLAFNIQQRTVRASD